MAKGNVVRIKNNKRINLGTVIFAVIFVYVVICVIISSKSQNIKGYQVKTGSLSENRIYNGIALRKETVVTSGDSGYISYFIREGERVAYNNLIYCIDETGKFSDLIGKDPTSDNSLTKDELSSLRQDIKLFSKNFNERAFTDARSFEGRMVGSLAQIENRMIIDDISNINSGHSNDIIDYCRAKSPGIALYYQDGYEIFLPSDLSEEDFNEENYERTSVFNDDLVEAGGFVYKYVFDENWSIVVLVPNDEVEKITSSDYVEVLFSKTGTSSWGKVTLINTFEENSLIQLSFTNSMITFCKDRFVEVELMLEEDKGLKIPNSAIANKSFYLIDKDFVTLGDNSSNYGVLRKEYTDDGSNVRFVEINIAKEDELEYYVDTSSLNYGDVIIRPGADSDSNTLNTFVVGKQGSLIGVYNINKGYADFKRIEILYQNDEYAIVKPNAAYGLRAYDYVALDAKIVTDKDFVY
ncbi:MAG: hypothetical protein K6E19_05255 [Lachnospiraceae bacterium]|nr:hypothetical protein [Lachnospiraceae bacterium]